MLISEQNFHIFKESYMSMLSKSTEKTLQCLYFLQIWPCIFMSIAASASPGITEASVVFLMFPLLSDVPRALCCD